MSRNVHWPRYESSNSTHSGRSDSDRSDETNPTEYSDRRPSLVQAETRDGRREQRSDPDYFASRNFNDEYETYPTRASVDTYASTSEEELADDDLDDMPTYQVPQCNHVPLQSEAIPTTPRDFAELFPTGKRISIRHDDATIDGNMNLRVDTQVEERGHRKHNYTLFHLRMQDLRTREFSLRRYCRESGREVCHSIRKYQKPPSERPVLQRASTALANLVKSDSRPSTSAGLKRTDSGYESVPSHVAAELGEGPKPKSVGYAKGRALMPTNTIKLEFSNYAHLDVKRRGAKSYKRYAFEYWGHDYSWKRIVKKEAEHESVSYYLVRDDNDKEPLAHICPVRLTAEEAHDEQARGGWVPPCYMRITDEQILRSDSDVSDVVVATGLMALVDDCIKRRFHSTQSTQLHIPLIRNASFKMNMEYIGPKRLIDEMFSRNTGPKKPSSGQRRVPAPA
ncbi:hypothetical protein HBH56_076360 [Parastagonospora nodorum]|uniref:Uncharacterized protein n=1 Tax=Phaeosphaeria nodorum (strain SN15 / ATCC MYA-4574 / FGSC 10173) TaxID=321614 RepID=A0A7U2IBP4_PHANO|nr:hypothetical protein HBH56_076360 [Parastagonospora nodorum]QRD06874.1 hypothetical protein JI435_127150 [Parastagonospora nodorum SN15]KAH3927471.1 hypothetical protein HBH54_156600 [Parastagonospora nodorum]KAH3981607.1 hypothetical protein HBH51_043310 [Parastagonospora nodorum]KAH3995552.1 hypothetical protein HBI10_169330 [Parastagonospora nodorum]